MFGIEDKHGIQMCGNTIYVFYVTFDLILNRFWNSFIRKIIYWENIHIVILVQKIVIWLPGGGEVWIFPHDFPFSLSLEVWNKNIE